MVLFCTVQRKSDNSNIQTFIMTALSIISLQQTTNYITHPKSSVIFLDAFKWIGRQCKVSADNLCLQQSLLSSFMQFTQITLLLTLKLKFTQYNIN